MLHRLKKRLYFVVAAYFWFWARFVLRRWRPRIIVITGSSGKTSLMHLVEAQMGDGAIYSHHANSAIGIPFDILGLPTNVVTKWHWPFFFLRAPLGIFRTLPKTKLYVVEADCDRPKEGKFLARLLKPEVTIWVSVYRTHSMNFDSVVKSGMFQSHEQAIAYEFGFFAANTNKLVVVNGDQPELVAQLDRVPTTTTILKMSAEHVSDYRLTKEQTVFTIDGQTIHLPGLHPRALGLGLQQVNALLNYLDKPFDPQYRRLSMPPGRSSVFQGKHDLTIIDSTYNTGLGAMTAIINLFHEYPGKHKWLVLGDILEQGSVEAEEHQRLADVITSVHADHVVLLGPRAKQHTYPILRRRLKTTPVVVFEGPKEVLDYLQDNLKGGETILFKGARGLEGVIAQLLANPEDKQKLVRREPIWVKRRQQWGLPE